MGGPLGRWHLRTLPSTNAQPSPPFCGAARQPHIQHQTWGIPVLSCQLHPQAPKPAPTQDTQPGFSPRGEEVGG